MTGVSKRFPGVIALKKVNLSLSKGEVLVLVGENGAGKSTLMKIIAGVHLPDEGEVVIENKKVLFLTPGESQKHGIRIVYQEQALIPDFNAVENIFVNAEKTRFLHSSLFGVLHNKDMVYKATEIINKTFELDIDLKKPIKYLPLIQKQIVEIIRAIVNNAKILILDEPTAALEDNEKQHLFAFINTIKKTGVGVIYCSHYLEECLEIGDKIIVLRDGRKVGETKKEETTVAKIIELMIGKSIAEQYPKINVPVGETPILTVRKLYRKKEYSDISFDLHPGEILGIAGLAGSGKTSLARSLFGIEPWNAGTISIGEKSYEMPYTVLEAMKRGIAFLPSDRKNEGLFLNETVRYNITLANLGAVTEQWLRKKLEVLSAQEFIDALHIKTPSQNTAVGRLSGGNQQKVLLARWLFKNSTILIFDEPTRGIDVNAKVEVYKLMGDFVRKGGAIIMVSSEVTELEGICDRVLVMHNGRIAAELKSEELKKETITYHSVVSSGRN